MHVQVSVKGHVVRVPWLCGGETLALLAPCAPSPRRFGTANGAPTPRAMKSGVGVGSAPPIKSAAEAASHDGGYGRP